VTFEAIGDADADGEIDVTVVLPCLNEKDAVGLCVAQAIEAMRNAGIGGEVIVVDNRSSDGSAEVAAAAGARVIREPRRGYGRALRTGFEQARGAVVVMADADGTYDLSKLSEIARPVMADEVDLNLATRLDGATRETMPLLHRYLGTPVITYLTSRASGRKLTADSQTGYRAFRRDRILDLGLVGNGMELASEMLIKSARAGLRIGNIEGGYSPRIGESKLDTWSDGWRHLKLILLLAPDIVLIGPGLTLAIAGVAALGLGFTESAGVEIGSARWQPVFFSGIALVIGIQAFFAGAVVSTYSPVAPSRRASFGFLRNPLWPRRAVGLGMLVGLLGVLIDLVLFVVWVEGSKATPTTGVGFGFASLAQSLLILGGSFAVFGVLARFVRSADDLPSRSSRSAAGRV
jgi:glycosyltransferase involved in cell wall biosynthesis